MSVLVGVAYHRSLPGGPSTSSIRRAATKIDGCGLVQLQSRSDHCVHLEPVVGDELLEVTLAVRDQPDLHPMSAKLVEDGEHVLVEREVLVPLPLRTMSVAHSLAPSASPPMPRTIFSVNAIQISSSWTNRPSPYNASMAATRASS